MKALKIAIVVLFVNTHMLYAQEIQFLTTGSISYEKSVNMHALIKKLYGKHMEGANQHIFDDYKKSEPQFKVLESTLIFNNDQTLFTPAPVETVLSNWFSLPMTDQNSIVYTDMSTEMIISQKNIFDKTFLLKDSLQSIKWKITDETRDVAGYLCRRANGILLDSVYVVAFFTEQIPISGGPEGFSGLPGMILEVALPHENLIWRATKVKSVKIPSSLIVPPQKGQVVNKKQLFDILTSNLKNESDRSKVNFIIKNFMY